MDRDIVRFFCTCSPFDFYFYIFIFFLDLDLLFDFISKQISPSEIAAFSALTSPQKITNRSGIEKNPHEYCFDALVHWSRIEPKINHRHHLIEYLKSTDDHNHAANLLESFSKDDYVFPSREINGPKKPVTISDLLILKDHLGPEYCHVVRFLGMKNRKFVQICTDTPDLKSRILTAMQSIQQLTRQKLCNALHYASRCDIIETLNKSWKQI